ELKEIRQQFPGRSPKAVEFRWHRFGGGQQERSPIAEESRKKHPWTTEEIERLRIALDKDMALFDIYQQFPGRTPSAIRRYITELRYAQDGIHQQHSRGALDDTAHTGNETENRNVGFNRRIRTHKPWTPKEDELLTDLVAKHSDDVPSLWDRMDDAYSKNRTNDFPVYRSGKSACKRWLQLNFAECRTGPWDAEEIVKLKQSIQQQIGNEFQVLLDVRHGDYAAEVETAEQDTRPGLKVGGPELKKLDWHKVSQQVGTKQAEECQRYLFYVLHNGRRGPWTLDEVQRLKDGVEKFGNRIRSFPSESRNCSSNRMLATISRTLQSTGYGMQLRHYIPSWTRSISFPGSLPPLVRHQSFAARQVFPQHYSTTSASTAPVLTSGKSNINKSVAKTRKTKTNVTATTAETKNKTSTNTIRKTRTRYWTPEECDKISQLIAEKKSLAEIHALFPHRTRVSIAMLTEQIQLSKGLDIDKKLRQWTIEEDEKLKELIQQGKSYREVWDEFPGRSNSAVLLRYYHFRDGRGQLKATITRGRQKRAWSEEELERVRDALNKGKTPLDIYQQFPGRSFRSVLDYYSEMKTIQLTADLVLQRRQQDGNQRDQPEGHPINRSGDSAHKAGVWVENMGAEPRLNSRKIRPWTSEEDDILAALVAEHSNDLPNLWRKLDGVYTHRRIGTLPLFRSGSSARTRWNQLHSGSRLRTGPWDAKEIMKLKQAIQKQVGDGFQVIVNVQRRVSTISADEKAKTEALRQDTRPLLELGGPELTGVNWHKVAEQVGTRNSKQCYVYLYYVLHNGNRGTWTPDEIERLDEGVKMFGKNWPKAISPVFVNVNLSAGWNGEQTEFMFDVTNLNSFASSPKTLLSLCKASDGIKA
ncbi:hypothetical protein BGZ51_008665, partial [Haplosporangium sp. Z 767]